jgi:hypothetical protein
MDHGLRKERQYAPTPIRQWSVVYTQPHSSALNFFSPIAKDHACLGHAVVSSIDATKCEGSQFLCVDKLERVRIVFEKIAAIFSIQVHGTFKGRHCSYLLFVHIKTGVDLCQSNMLH